MVWATIERGASGEGYFAVPKEGSSFFISKEQFLQLRLSVRQELSEEEFNSLHTKITSLRCRDKALDYLARREHTRRELEVKLLNKGFSKELIGPQLDQLEGANLLSDYRFAQNYIASRLRKSPEGAKMLIMRLLQKGVSREMAQTVIQNSYNSEEALELALERAIRRVGKEREDLLKELQKRGFSYYEITTFLDEKGEGY
ncbi:MAG: regulatory protein RecX [Sphaerochaetaceae bacterium]